MHWGCQFLQLIKMAFGAYTKNIDIQNAQNVRRWPAGKSFPMCLQRKANLKVTYMRYSLAYKKNQIPLMNFKVFDD